MNSEANTTTKIAGTLRRFLFGGRLVGHRLRVTLIHSGKPIRFENKIFRIFEKGQLPERFSRFIGVKLTHSVDPKFGLWKNHIIFLDPWERVWMGFVNIPEASPRFMVEVVGLIYNYRDYFDPTSWRPGSVWYDSPSPLKSDHSAEMDTFGISISGYNIRCILFKKLYNREWRDSDYTKESIFFVKGKKLLDLLMELLESDCISFTWDEMNVITRYLGQDVILNPSAH